MSVVQAVIGSSAFWVVLTVVLLALMIFGARNE